ncbi:hypothetical protein IB211_02670c [Intestinimonas butyriciproducens]|uniref:Uncharacterized protein n=1 Tax=Intestinimonas butyriciproducens TaxID=1297617 RepID=A0A0S2W6T6_9FIRM|nr:hypothetical protein IB211_02670c [Intestinimonas butyriciproducens]
MPILPKRGAKNPKHLMPQGVSDFWTVGGRTAGRREDF